MKIQDILWPKDGICTDMEMYFHSNYKRSLVKEEGVYILFQKGGIVTTDTYFNSLTIEKWRKYTKVSKVLLTLSLQGKFNVSLCWKQKINEMYVERELKNKTVNVDRSRWSSRKRRRGCSFSGWRRWRKGRSFSAALMTPEYRKTAGL